MGPSVVLDGWGKPRFYRDSIAGPTTLFRLKEVCFNMYYSGDQIKKNEMGGGWELYNVFLWGNLRQIDNLEDL